MLISAVMITGKHPSRVSFARVAVQCFLDQTYKEKELIIINDSGTRLASDHPQIREYLVPYSPGVTLGTLRNLGIEKANGEAIIQWDDDDWHHPSRIARQAASFRPGITVLLREQIRYSFIGKRGILHKSPGGIHGTILHERQCGMRYPAMRRSEDTAFLCGFANRAVVSSSPPLYIRFYHGANTWGIEHVMSAADHHLELSLRDKRLLKSVLTHHYRFTRTSRFVDRNRRSSKRLI